MINKACPVVLRKNNGDLEILAFTHPLAGNQIVKGSIELGETLQVACIRELQEEAGINASPIADLGEWDDAYNNTRWGFCLMQLQEPLPDSWEFYCTDDGGHLFKFFWQPLHCELDEHWHSVFTGAIQFIKGVLNKERINLSPVLL